MKFYEIVLGKKAGNFWCPPDPRTAEKEIDARLFMKAVEYTDAASLAFPPTDGSPAHFALGAFLYPVVDRLTFDVLSAMDDQIQGVPVKTAHGEYWIVNALRSVACIDEEASIFERFTVTGVRPDLAGQYEVFYKLRLHPTMVPEGAHLFRVRDYENALIASETLRDALSSQKLDDGIGFECVT